MFVSREISPERSELRQQSLEGCERSCRCGLLRAEGRKVAAARCEGRIPVATTESSDEIASRPSSQRVAAPFQAAERRSSSRQRFVVRAGRRCHESCQRGRPHWCKTIWVPEGQTPMVDLEWWSLVC